MVSIFGFILMSYSYFVRALQFEVINA